MKNINKQVIFFNKNKIIFKIIINRIIINNNNLNVLLCLKDKKIIL